MNLLEAIGWFIFAGLLPLWGVVAVLSVAWLFVGLRNEARMSAGRGE